MPSNLWLSEAIGNFCIVMSPAGFGAFQSEGQVSCNLSFLEILFSSLILLEFDEFFFLT